MSSLFAKKMQMKNYEGHVRRLQGASSVVDTSKPVNKKPPSMKLAEQRRLRDESIIQENCNMLDRLAKVMQQKRIDNDGDQYLRLRKSNRVATAKKHELQRITEENKRLLRRIQEVNPVYDHIELESRAKKNEYLRRQMSDFKEVHLPPQIESWLQEKNRLVKSSRKTERNNQMTKRVTYTPPITTSVLQRSRSATMTRTPKWYEDEDVVDMVDKNDDLDEPERRDEPTVTKKKRHKPKGRKKSKPTNSLRNNGNSPLRGRIRPKSGKI